jgi:hypothetical protein
MSWATTAQWVQWGHWRVQHRRIVLQFVPQREINVSPPLPFYWLSWLTVCPPLALYWLTLHSSPLLALLAWPLALTLYRFFIGSLSTLYWLSIALHCKLTHRCTLLCSGIYCTQCTGNHYQQQQFCRPCGFTDADKREVLHSLIIVTHHCPLPVLITLLIPVSTNEYWESLSTKAVLPCGFTEADKTELLVMMSDDKWWELMMDMDDGWMMDGWWVDNGWTMNRRWMEDRWKMDGCWTWMMGG